MNIYKTIIIFFILKNSYFMESLCYLTMNQTLNSTLEYKGFFYLKTENYFYLRNVKD